MANFILTLLGLPGVGRRTVHKILGRVTDLPAGCSGMYAAVRAVWPDTRFNWSADDFRAAHQRAGLITERARAMGIRMLVPADADFPPRLGRIPDPPVILFARGNVGVLQDPLSVAVIGTRQPCGYSREAAFRIARTLAGEGMTIVSGLAAGCDTAGHEGCLDRNGCTVATLAHGVDLVYPPQNKGLAQRIVEAGGCLLSEYPPGETPQPWYFVERDRLQSGLGSAVVVIETNGEDGTMHTVRFARQQGRLLACLEHPAGYAGRPETRGNRMLLAEGALPLATAGDVGVLVEKIKNEQT